MDFSEVNSIERDIFLMINGKHNPFMDTLMSSLNSLLVWIPLIIVLGLYVIRFYTQKEDSYMNAFLVISLISVLMVICWIVLPPLVESYVHRITPCFHPEVARFAHLLSNCDTKFSFFALRPSLAFALFVFVFMLFRNNMNWLVYFLFFWAILFSYNRIYLGVHFPLNVLFADIVGVLLGFTCYKVYVYFKNEMLVI